jgi:hypothetical protein
MMSMWEERKKNMYTLLCILQLMSGFFFSVYFLCSYSNARDKTLLGGIWIILVLWRGHHRLTEGWIVVLIKLMRLKWVFLRLFYRREMPLNPSIHWMGEWVGNRVRGDISIVIYVYVCMYIYIYIYVCVYIYIYIYRRKNETEINCRNNKLGSIQTSSYTQSCLIYYLKHFFFFQKMYASINFACTSRRLQ